MSWVGLALALIKLANLLITRAHDNSLISEGEDRAIARETAAILEKSRFAKQVMEQTSSLTEAQTDDVLRQLGAS